MRILLTGGAGFIGYHAARRLLGRGDEVVIVDNFNKSYDPKIKFDRVDRLWRDFQAGDERADIIDTNHMEQIFKNMGKFDAVLHLAAQAGVRYSFEHPGEVMDINVTGTANLMDLAVKFNVPNFVFASSSSVYGNRTDERPFREEDNTDFPVSPYAASKKACELLGYAFSREKGLNVTGLRFFTVYGPDSRPDMFHRLAVEAIVNRKGIQLFDNGSGRRDYTYVDDIVDGIAAALDKPFRYEIFNLGGDEPIKTIDVVRRLERGLGMEAMIDPREKQKGDVDYTCADISKAGRLLGYERRVSFEEGMTRYCEWAREAYRI